MNKEVEDFIESVRKAKQMLKPRKPITLRNPIIKGIKLSTPMIAKIDTGYTMPFDRSFHQEQLMGISVIRDETVDYPRYIIEGEIEEIDDVKPSEAMECLDEMYELSCDGKKPYYELYEYIKQALRRLDKYEQILGSGRLTDRNYKNTTLDIGSCKPYLRLGQLEDVYEESEKNVYKN